MCTPNNKNTLRLFRPGNQGRCSLKGQKCTGKKGAFQLINKDLSVNNTPATSGERKSSVSKPCLRQMVFNQYHRNSRFIASSKHFNQILKICTYLTFACVTNEIKLRAFLHISNITHTWACICTHGSTHGIHRNHNTWGLFRSHDSHCISDSSNSQTYQVNEISNCQVFWISILIHVYVINI